MKTEKGTTWILAALLFFAGPLAFGENPGQVQSNAQIPAVPTVTEAGPAKPVDRQRSNAAAVALAMGAASQQKIACYMMMQEAMKPENKEDKNMLMALAMQMCAQADQTMANALKNKENAKLVSAEDIPKQSKLKISNVQFGQDKVTEAEVPKIDFDDNARGVSTGVSEIEDLLANQPLPETDLGVFDAPPPADGDLGDPIDKVLNDPLAQGGETSVPEAIGRQVAEEKSDSQSTTFSNNSPLGGGGLRVSSLGGVGSGDGKSESKTIKISSKSEGGSGRGRSGIRKADIGSGGGGGGDESSSSGGSNIDSLMAELMGKSPAGSPPAGSFGGGPDIVTLPGKKNPQDKLPNVFEYATFRYRKLAFDKGRIKPQKILAVKLPKSSTISQVSKRFTAAAKDLDTDPNR